MGCMRSVMMAEAFGMRPAVVGGCVGAACSRPVATPSMARLAARRVTPCSNKLWARASIGKWEQGTQPQARSQRPWLNAMSAVGFEPARSYLQWILSPPLDHSGKLTSDKGIHDFSDGLCALS